MHLRWRIESSISIIREVGDEKQQSADVDVSSSSQVISKGSDRKRPSHLSRSRIFPAVVRPPNMKPSARLAPERPRALLALLALLTHPEAMTATNTHRARVSQQRCAS